jgi:hypothetical protein
MKPMPKPSFRILLKDFVHPDPSAMRLSVDAGPYHLSLTLILTAERKIVGFESYNLPQTGREEEALAVLSESPLAEMNYGSVSITFNTEEFVLIPDRFYHPDIVEDSLALVHGDLPTNVSATEHLQEMGMHNLYRVPMWLHQCLTQRFHQAGKHHGVGLMLSSILKRNEDWSSTCIHLWFYTGHVLSAIYKDGKLLISNWFPYEIPEDLSYTLLNAVEQYGLDPGDVPVMVSGFIDRDSIIFEELMKYFLVVETDNGGGTFIADDIFSGYPDHYFTPAFSIAVCGS